jgi:hypothetical protein
MQDEILSRILGVGEPERSPSLFVDPPQGTIEARWHVYADGYVARIAEAIENDYPALNRVLGARALRSLTARYLARFPPRSHDLGRVGDRLPGFLEGDSLTQELPFLPDLARLEWTVAEAFVAADGNDLRWDDLARLGPEAVAELPLQLRPGAGRVRSAWPIYDIWTVRERPAPEIEVALEGRPCSVLVSRRGLDVICRPLGPVEDRVLNLAVHGGRMAGLVDETEETASALVAAFRALVEDAVFARWVDGSPPAG